MFLEDTVNYTDPKIKKKKKLLLFLLFCWKLLKLITYIYAKKFVEQYLIAFKLIFKWIET